MSFKKKFATIGAIGVLSAGTIYAINKFIYLSSTLENLLSKKYGDFYEWRFGNIYYTKKGEGKPILLIHDLSSTSSGYEWNRIVSDLSRNHCVYTIDLLGCGRSDKPNITYTNFLYVQLISDFIKHIIGDKVDMIATGESSSIALMSAHYNDSIIDKIMLVNPVSLVELAKIPTKRTKSLRYLINIPAVGTLLYNMLTTKHNIENAFQKDYFYDSSKTTDKMINTYYETAHIGNAKSKYIFSSIKGRYTNTNILQCLKTINNSIFIIVGNGNPNNYAIAEQYKDYTASIEIVGIEHTKQLPQLESPHEFLEQTKILFEY